MPSKIVAYHAQFQIANGETYYRLSADLTDFYSAAEFFHLLLGFLNVKTVGEALSIIQDQQPDLNHINCVSYKLETISKLDPGVPVIKWGQEY